MRKILGGMAVVTSLGLGLLGCSGGSHTEVPVHESLLPGDVQPQGPFLTIVDPAGGPFTLAGSVIGLKADGLELSDGFDTISIDQFKPTFVFPHAHAANSNYVVTIASQPSRLGNRCSISASRGKMRSTVKNVQVVCTSEEKSAFSAMLTGEKIHWYDFDPSTANMTYRSSIDWDEQGGGGAGDEVGMVVHPYRPLVYVVSNQHDRAWTYVVDKVNGSIKQVSSVAFETTGNQHGLRIHPNGKYAYIYDRSAHWVERYTVDSDNGALEHDEEFAIPNPSDNAAMDIDPDGRFLYVSASKSMYSYTINGADDGGGLTDRKTVALPEDSVGVAVHPNKTLIFALMKSGGIASIEVHEDGTMTVLATTPTPVPARTYAYIKVDPTGRYLAFHEINSGTKEMHTFLIDGKTGVLSGGHTSPMGGDGSELQFTQDGQHIFTKTFGGQQFEAYKVDLTSGVMTRTPKASLDTKLTTEQPLGFVLY